EVQEGDVQPAGNRIHVGIRELKAVLRIRGIGVWARRKNGLGTPGCAAVDRAPEAQLPTGGLETTPGDINIVAVLADRVGSYCKPLFVAAVILLHNNGITPGAAAVG